MRFLSVADRELRCLARQKTTFRTRWINGLMFFGLLVWLLWVFDGFKNQRVAPSVFKTYSFVICLYCLFYGAARTADCISSERREGTLGLLFLTNLSSGEILLGKLCSTALASAYGFLAVFPMLALPLLLGGITFSHFAYTALGILDAMFFALSAGFLVSVICRRQFVAIAVALAVSIGFGLAMLLAGAVAQQFTPTRPFADWLAMLSPLYAVLTADQASFFGPNHYWLSLASLSAAAVVCLGLTTQLLAWTWQDRPQRSGWRGMLRRYLLPGNASSVSLTRFRTRLLEINPMFWLAGRQRVSAPVIMVLSVALTLVAVYVGAPIFGRLIKIGIGAPVFGHMFAWLWTAILIHGVVLYYAAMNASQRLAEDKETGALELILSTPTSEEEISRGLWLAYARKMCFPALLAVLAHVYFCWLVMNLAVIQPPGELPDGITPGQLFWSALFNEQVPGGRIEWGFCFMVRIVVFLLLQFIALWVALGAVGRWLGLRIKHAGFAPIVSLALLIVPPILLFSLACFLAGRFHLDRLLERRLFPLMLWTAVAIGLGHCLIVFLWARGSLRRRLRLVAMSRYQPPERWRFRLPSWRLVLRFGLITVGIAVCLALTVGGYYQYQNWRGRQTWKRFQQELTRRGESAGVTLPAGAPAASNFALSPAFMGLLASTNKETKELLKNLSRFDLHYAGNDSQLMDWTRQQPSKLDPFITWNPQQTKRNIGTNRADIAAAVLTGLESQTGALDGLAEAVATCSSFQSWSNDDFRAVFEPGKDKVRRLEQIHLIFVVRSSAFLIRGEKERAFKDWLAGIRLIRLAERIPDVYSAVRAQEMLMRSLQPIWDGLAAHAWTEPELAQFQKELATFNFLAEYTNTVNRLVCAHIEAWRGIAESTNRTINPPSAGGGKLYEAEVWALQPRAWWLENCVQLYEAGKRAVSFIDVSNGRVAQTGHSSDIEGLPMDYSMQQLLEPTTWYGPYGSTLSFAQTSLNQAMIACALERFRLAHGNHPERLEEVMPDWLGRIPNDAVSGRPLSYQLDPTAGVVIRGVGLDGLDDRTSGNNDDWLWMYSTNKPAVKARLPKMKK